MRHADRLDRIPPYPFAELDRRRRAAIERGVKVISLGIGDPDRPTPEHIVQTLCREAGRPQHHTYPPYEGLAVLRTEAASWYERTFGPRVDPDTETMVTIGSKEAIAHMIWAWVNPGDIVLVPDPAYPVYAVQTLLAGGEPYQMPLTKANGFLPDFEAIPADIRSRARLMFLNYPNNPTAAVADRAFFQQAVQFCLDHDILLCHDAAYAEITYDGYRAVGILEIDGARDCAVELHSLSKPFNMTGWRIGFTVGNAGAVAALGRIKENTDSGQFGAIQMAAVEALRTDDSESAAKRSRRYADRRDRAIEAFRSLGWNIEPPRATFYLWLPVPRGFTSSEFASHVLDSAGVVVSPGTSFGAHGEGYVRISLTVDDELLDEALGRLKTTVQYR